MRLTLCLEGNTEGRVLASIDMEEIMKHCKANINLSDTIRDIHDSVANEMYCKGIDDLTEKLKEMANNSSTKYIRLSEKETITTYGVEQIAEELKEMECD